MLERTLVAGFEELKGTIELSDFIDEKFLQDLEADENMEFKETINNKLSLKKLFISIE
jgi:hypothetical protein